MNETNRRWWWDRTIRARRATARFSATVARSKPSRGFWRIRRSPLGTPKTREEFRGMTWTGGSRCRARLVGDRGPWLTVTLTTLSPTRRGPTLPNYTDRWPPAGLPCATKSPARRSRSPTTANTGPLKSENMTRQHVPKIQAWFVSRLF